ncbi:MAG: hypothetical protein R3211_06245 [Balneolaceae bacterium]|nr:hypothetical protein [Balneolaceae bacterium]
MYILDYHRQIALIREMTVLRKDDENWVVYYHHPSTNEMWKSYFPRSNGNRRGPKILRTEPVPENIGDQLDQCLKSDVEENAIGLGIEMSVNPARWHAIISHLEENYRKYSRKQLKLYLESLGIANWKKILEELKKDPEDFGLTEKEFRQLSWRARKIRFKRFWFI